MKGDAAMTIGGSMAYTRTKPAKPKLIRDKDPEVFETILACRHNLCSVIIPDRIYAGKRSSLSE